MTEEWLSTSALDKIDGLPDFGYRVCFDHEFPERCAPFKFPRLHQMKGYVVPFFRYLFERYKKVWEGKKFFLDNFSLCPWRPIYGAPLGGIGCGTIGRGYRGEFCRFQMVPGMYEYNVVDANQFVVCICKDGESIYQRVLSPHGAPNDGSLSSWQWLFPDDSAVYHALYPQSWTVYNIPEVSVRLICRQISPIFPHDYQDTSLPCGVFVWTVCNDGNVPLDVSIVMTFKNGQGCAQDKEGGVWSEEWQYGGSSQDEQSNAAGIMIHQMFKNMPCTYAIGAKCMKDVNLTGTLAFNPRGSGEDLWEDLREDGELSLLSTARSPVTSRGEELACAVCCQRSVAARSQGTVEFSLVWDMPDVRFSSSVKVYRRRYTKFFGATGKVAPLIAHYALNNHPIWQRKIEDWQGPILRNNSLPAWYKSALFNELYYVSDGGTIWVHSADSDADGNADGQVEEEGDLCEESELVREYGRFAYLEGHEYRMYNTYDVHHYASFALIMLWPMLQLSLQYDIAATIPVQSKNKVRFLIGGEVNYVKTSDCVPHDVGDPDDEPWTRLNAYIFHPTVEWKDLNTKFVLQVYRDYVCTKDRQYLSHMYPLVKRIIERSLRWDTDDDGLIDNAGFADQTYDAWTATGASAYCGGMWLAALKVCCEMAKSLGKTSDGLMFAKILEKGRASFDRKLWNGKYYNYDCSTSRQHDSVMADQLAGHWFLKACDIPDDTVFPRSNVLRALYSIYKCNVLPFDEGKMGAINGMRPDGRKDTTSVQSEEFWTGVNYALAATMIHEGMDAEGWQVGYGVYHTCWERYGLAFQTPEAYLDDGHFRSLGYMRPLSIWSIQYALERGRPELFQSVGDQ